MMRAAVVSVVSQNEYCRSAEKTPSGMPSSSMSTAATASWIVTGAASQIISATSRPVYSEVPRSPWARAPTYL